MIKFKENEIILIIFISIIILFGSISIFSTGSFGGGDTYCHYRIAKYAFQYPHLFLDLWGKPIFTLLAAPFAQFGYDGIKFFNITIGLFAAFLAYKIAKIQNYANAPLVIIFTCFAPIYMAIMFTAMTEILLGLFIIAGAFLIFKDKYIWAAIVISFAPFARSEGYAFILLYLFIFLIYKQYKAIPFLISGILIYSIVGFFYYFDFLWIFHQNPYSLHSDIYGKGSFLFYINRFHWISGKPFAILIAIGFIISSFLLIKKKLNIQNPLLKEFLCIHLAFIGYLFLHSFLWWKGLMSVLADNRFMASIMPLGGVIALHGFNFFISKIKWEILYYATIFLTIIVFVATPFYTIQFPIKPTDEQAVIIKATKWLKETNNDKFKIYYYDPLIAFELGKNPYDTISIHEKVYDINQPEFLIEDSSIVIWDAHFAANEGQLPLNKLLNNPYFVIENYFTPDYPFKTLGGYNYEVYIFRKVSKKNVTKNITKYYFINNFDENNYTNIFLDTTIFVSKKKSLILSSENIYSPAIVINTDTINWPFIAINAQLQCYFQSNEDKNKLFLVISIEKNEKSNLYRAVNAENEILKNNWITINNTVVIKPIEFKNHLIKIYAWYTGSSKVNIDDLEVKINKIQ